MFSASGMSSSGTASPQSSLTHRSAADSAALSVALPGESGADGEPQPARRAARRANGSRLKRTGLPENRTAASLAAAPRAANSRKGAGAASGIRHEAARERPRPAPRVLPFARDDALRDEVRVRVVVDRDDL